MVASPPAKKRRRGRPRKMDATDFSVLDAAEDLDVVEIIPGTLAACAPLFEGQGTLDASGIAFWESSKFLRGIVRERLRNVAIVRVGETFYILDGATRAEAWRQGIAKPPKTLNAAFHVASTMEEARALRSRYESTGRIERSESTILAAYKTHGLSLTSARLASGWIAHAIDFAFRGSVFGAEAHPSSIPINLTDAIGLITEELAFLDQTGCPKNVFYSGILGMSILGLGIDERAKEFVERIARKSGNKRDGKMDPVEGVVFLALLTDLKDRADVEQYQPELFARSLRGLSAWLDGDAPGSRYWFKSQLQKADPQPLIRRFREAKGIVDRSDL